MSDVNANINISIDSSQALGQLKALQSQISAFNQSLVSGNVAAARAQADMVKNLSAQINATKAFSTSITNVESSVSRLGKAIDSNKLSLGEYFRYGIAASGKFGRAMKEHNDVMGLAEQRVKRLQTQYIALEQSHNGYTRSMAVRPTNLFNADSAIAIQRQQIFNKLLHDGSTALVNWGKNTQWAGRQLMVGFTVPLTIFGGVAGKIFMDLEKQVVQFKRVYGDLTTSTGERNAMVEEVKAMGKEFTKYGITVSDTVALAAKAAATGVTGADLIAQTTEATRLATLGQIDYQQALDATISLQTAFGTSSKDLADATNFLNAVENQTVTSLDDITQAIPLVAPVIKGLGGDVKDLAIFMTAMREGGISANEGANALKSGLASLINPTKAAREQLSKVGIDIDTILSKNKGDLRGLVTEFGSALGTLGKFERQQTLAKMFGKYQFARLGALFQNISKEGTQASRVIDLTAMSTKDLGQIAEGELSQVEQAVGVKFTAAVEKLKLAIAPIGEAFLKIATPIIDFATKIADKFNELPDAAKTFITWGTAIGGVLIPTVIMLVGLLGNFAGNMLKISAAIGRLMGKTGGLSSGFQYLTNEELDAAAAAASLEGKTTSLTGALNVQRGAVNRLAAAYGAYVSAAGTAAANIPQGFRGATRRMATGGFVAGSGNKDSEPALLMPGEFVVNKKAAQQNADILSAMNSGTLKRYAEGSKSLVGGQELVLAPHTMLAPGNTPGGFGMDPSFFYGGKGFEESLRATAVSVAGIEGKITLTEKAVTQMSAELLPYTEEITSALRTTAQEMKDSGQEATHISQIFDKAAPRLQKIFAKMEATGGNAAMAAKGLKKFAYPTEQDYLAEGERRAPAVVRSQSGRDRFTQYRTRRSKSLTRTRSVFEKMFGRVPSGFTSAHVTPENQKILGDVVPFSGAMAGETGSTRAKSEAKIKSMSEQNAKLYGTTFEETLAKQDATGKGLATETGRNSPHEQAVKNGHDDGRAYDEAFDQETQSGRRGRRSASRPAGPPNYQNGVKMLPANMGLQIAPPDVQNRITSSLNSVSKESGTVAGKFKSFGNTLTKGSAKLSGSMFALDGLVFGLSMMDNSIGQFAQNIMPVVFGLQGLQMMLPLIMNPVGGTIAAFIAVGAGLWVLNSKVDEIKDNSRKLSEAMYGSTESLNSMAEFFGKKTWQQKMASAATKAVTGTKITNERATQASEFVSSDPGKKLLEDTKLARDTYGTAGAVKALQNNLKRMILEGIIDPKTAFAIATELGNQLGNYKIGVDVAANINQIFGPDGEKVNNLNDRLNVIANITGDTTNLEDAFARAGLQWDGASWFTQIAMIVKGEGTADLFAENAVADMTNKMQAYQTEISRVQLLFENGKITAQEYQNRIAKIFDASKVISWENTVKESQRIFGDQFTEGETAFNNLADNFGKSLTDAIQSSLGADSLDKFNKAMEVTMNAGLGNETFSLLDADRVANMVDRLNNAGKNNEALQLLQKQKAAMNLAVSVKSPNFPMASLQKILDGKDVSFDAIASLSIKYDDPTAQAIASIAGGILEPNSHLDLMIRAGLDKGNLDYAGTWLQYALEAQSIGVDLHFITSRQETIALKQAIDDVREFEKLPSPITKKAMAKFWEEGYELTDAQMKAFLAMPDGEKREFFSIYRTIIAEPERMSAVGAASIYSGSNSSQNNPNLSMYVSPKDLVNAGQQKTINSALGLDGKKKPYVPSKPPVNPSGGGSGAGGTKEDPLAGYKEWWNNLKGQLKLFTNIEDVAKKGELKKNELQKIFRRGAFGFDGGLVADMRKAGLSESLISDLLSKGYTEAKKIFNILKKRNKLVQANRGALLAGAGQTISDNIGAVRINQAQLGAVEQLRKMGANEDTVKSISNDPDKAQQFIALWNNVRQGIKGAKDRLDEFVASEANAAKYAKDVENAFADPFDAAMNTFDQLTTMMDQAYTKMEDNKRNELAADFAKKNGMTVEAMQDQIRKNNRLIDQQQAIVDKKQEEINDYQHINDLTQQHIDDMRREDELRNRVAENLQHELDLMSKSEQKINDAFDARLEALDKTAKINDYIINQNKRQISLAQALSEGDIYAAAEAANEITSAQADFSTEQTRAALQDQRQGALDSLTNAQGLTRAQMEDQIAAIKEQSYQASLRIRAEEDKIYQTNLLIRNLSNEIYDIEELTIEPLVNQNKEYQRLIDYHTEDVDLAIANLTIAGKTREQWKKQNDEMRTQISNARELHPELLTLAADYERIAAALERAARAALGSATYQGSTISPPVTSSTTSNPTAGMTDQQIRDYYASDQRALENPNGYWVDVMGAGRIWVTNYKGGFVKKYKGGLMKKYAAAGQVSGDGSRDTIASMLTPGEFVIRKSMVNKYGQPMLDAINTGSFVMPNYNSLAAEKVQANVPSSENGAAAVMSHNPVYNSYNVNVSANTNASPDDIANKVIMKIRGIDNMAVRGYRGN